MSHKLLKKTAVLEFPAYFAIAFTSSGYGISWWSPSFCPRDLHIPEPFLCDQQRTPLFKFNLMETLPVAGAIAMGFFRRDSLFPLERKRRR